MSEQPNENKWKAKIKVDGTIINILSGSIYRSIHIALKEFVSNAWDADATNVEIFVREDTNKILIIDDGKGMDKAALENYPNVAMSDKQKNPLTKLNRPTVGKYGVGIWSALPFCSKITVQSTKKGSNEVNYLVIDNVWTDEHGKQKIVSGRELDSFCDGETYYDDEIIDQQGTTIVLDGIFDGIWRDIQSQSDKRYAGVMKFSGIERIKWYLQQYTPIEYEENADPYKSFFGTRSYEPMNLFLNGKKLHRNIVEDVIVLEKCDCAEIPDTGAKCKFIIVSSKKPIEPEELRGLQIRLKNVAVGTPKDFNVYQIGRLQGKASYIAGEIEILEGMEDQINLEREDFLRGNQRDAFFDYFRKKIADSAFKTETYSEGQKLIRAYGEKSDIKNVESDFLAKDSIRESSVEKITRSKSKSSIKKELKGTLKKVGYKVVENPIKDNNSSVKIDHDKKIVYINENQDEKQPLFVLFGEKIFESETDADIFEIVEINDNNTISFNYSHPLFKNTSDVELIKKIIGSVFLTLRNENVPESNIEKVREALDNLADKSKEN